MLLEYLRFRSSDKSLFNLMPLFVESSFKETVKIRIEILHAYLAHLRSEDKNKNPENNVSSKMLPFYIIIKPFILYIIKIHI